MSHQRPVQTRITLKGLKVASFLSEETLAYAATVYFDGLKVATADNDGHGGMTNVRAFPDTREALQQAEAFAKSLPPTQTQWKDPTDPTRPFVIASTLDGVVDDLAHDAHQRKQASAQLSRLLKASIVMVDEGKVMTVKPQDKTLVTSDTYRQQIRARYPNATLLNPLPKEEALDLFLRYG